MAPLPGVRVGPLDPDTTADFGSVGRDNNARLLVKAHGKLMPPALRGALLKTQNVPRSKALVKHMAEVEEAALDYRTDTGERVLPDGATVVGANVRGEEDDPDKVVTITFRLPLPPDGSGRTGKAFMPYTDEMFPESVEDGDDRVRIADERDRGGTGLPADLAKLFTEVLSGARRGGEDGGEQDARVAQLEESVVKLTAALEEERNPEPYEGYGEASVEEVEARIDQETNALEREVLKLRIREAEQRRNRPRKGVLDATEPVELAPVESS